MYTEAWTLWWSKVHENIFPELICIYLPKNVINKNKNQLRKRYVTKQYR